MADKKEKVALDCENCKYRRGCPFLKRSLNLYDAYYSDLNAHQTGTVNRLVHERLSDAAPMCANIEQVV